MNAKSQNKKIRKMKKEIKELKEIVRDLRDAVFADKDISEYYDEE